MTEDRTGPPGQDLTRVPIRVLYFIGSMSTGGSEAHLTRLLCALDRRVVEPELLVLQADEGSHLLQRVRSAGIRVHDLKLRLGRTGIPQAFFRALGRIRALAPQVLQSYGWPCDIYAPVIAALLGFRIKVVTTRRGNQQFARRRWAYRLTHSLTARVLCVSHATGRFAREQEGLPASLVQVIPNGVDAAVFHPGTQEAGVATRIGVHARLASIKGVDLLVEAFLALGRSGLSLEIAGPATDDWGVSLRERYAGEASISFGGPTVDAPGFLRSIHVFVLPSRSEGMSMALLEAMATGLPIVATDVGSNRELLDDGRAGIVVEPRAEAIAKGLAWILDHPEEAADLGRAARRRIEAEYDELAMVRRYERFYLDLVRPPPNGLAARA